MIASHQPERQTSIMANLKFLDAPPGGDAITPYDEAHHDTYWRLLDAETEKADWKEVVKLIFGIDPDQETMRARKMHDSHLARARWMTQTGYRKLL